MALMALRLQPVKQWRLTPSKLTLLLSVYFVAVINFPFMGKIISILSAYDHINWAFALSIPLFLLGVFNLLFLFFSFKYLMKPAFIVLLLVSTMACYAYYNYGLYMDVGMVGNIAETNYGEALSYLNPTAIIWLCVMGGIPAVAVYFAPVTYAAWTRELLYKLVAMGLSVLFFVSILFVFYKDYASLGRNNSYLNNMIIPTYYMSSIGKFVNRQFIQSPVKFEPLGTDAKIVASTNKPNLIVFMLGETARAKNFQLNGYDRETNPFTSALNPVSFKNVSSCGTATNVSVPCMFSRFSRDNFDNKVARNQDNVIDILQHAGASAIWLENDGGCKGVCDRTQTIEFSAGMESPWCDGEYCKDEILLEHFDDALSKLGGDNQFLVMHMVGSHGPTYYQRYPDEFRRFQPDCPRSDVQNCSDEAITNTYDNTLYYDDYVMAEIIKKLDQLQERYNTGLIYMSDHGESLGENGLYLHGMPYSLAPQEQTHIPWLMWLSPALSEHKGIDTQCLDSKATTGAFSHDNLFDSLLGLMDVDTGLYQPELDVFESCRGVTAQGRYKALASDPRDDQTETNFERM